MALHGLVCYCIALKALVSATQLSGAQSARSLRLSASAAQILSGERERTQNH